MLAGAEPFDTLRIEVKEIGSPQPEFRKYLKQAGRSSEILVGWACALISIATAGLLVFLVYVAAWRNPHQYGSQDYLKPGTLAFFAVLLSIALGFSVFASRLIRGKKSGQRLMSPLVLRIWGAFFSAGGILLFADCVIHHRWKQVPHVWEMLTFLLSMGAAAFVLAGNPKDNGRTR